MEKEKLEEVMVEYEDRLDREHYNIEISEQILDRIRQETNLVKERVREIQKVESEIDKKIKTAKILQIYAKHSKGEVIKEMEVL